mmetsp:Transcript_32071/g.92132  ORF Transcript_32071/g.92132 Transcript_32071/m.92132 type:complete len:246 (-) Transcript_32071:125-862(-)
MRRLLPHLLQLLAQQLGLQRQRHEGPRGAVGLEAHLRLPQGVAEAHGVAVEGLGPGDGQPGEVVVALHQAQHVRLGDELEVCAGGALERLHGCTIKGLGIGLIVGGIGGSRPWGGGTMLPEASVEAEQKGLGLLPERLGLGRAGERDPQQLVVPQQREALRRHLEDSVQGAASRGHWPQRARRKPAAQVAQRAPVKAPFEGHAGRGAAVCHRHDGQRRQHGRRGEHRHPRRAPQDARQQHAVAEG